MKKLTTTLLCACLFLTGVSAMAQDAMNKDAMTKDAMAKDSMAKAPMK